MASQAIIVDAATASVIRQAVYLAHAYGKINERQRRDIFDTLNGLPRNVACEGRAFHDNPQHVCAE